MIRRLVFALPLLASACASPDPGQRIVGDTTIGAGAGCAMGAVATIWFPPAAIGGCAIGAAMGAAGGAILGTASAVQQQPYAPQPYAGW